MAELQTGKSYTIVEDFSGKSCRGRVANFVIDNTRMPAATFDVSEDNERDIKFWGNVVIVMSRYPEMPINNFGTPVALVEIKKLSGIPSAGTFISTSDGEVIGSGRGRVEGDFS